MSTFKSFLAEATQHPARVNVTKFGLDGVVACYQNAGYQLSAQERKLFLKSKYNGFARGKHVFWVLAEDDNEEGNFYVTRFFIELNEEGLLAAEPSGRPDFEGDRKAMEEMFNEVN